MRKNWNGWEDKGNPIEEAAEKKVCIHIGQRQHITDDIYKCLECGQQFRQLTSIHVTLEDRRIAARVAELRQGSDRTLADLQREDALQEAREVIRECEERGDYD